MIKWPNQITEHVSAVAWKAEKKVFLFKTETSVGVNDRILVHVISENQHKRILVKIPVRFFNSGDQIRDEKVFWLLSGDKCSDLEFKSELISDERWSLIISNQHHEISGQLKIGDIERNLIWTIRVTTTVQGLKAEGQCLTTLSNFKIKPPILFFGLAAKVVDQISLHFCIYEKDVVFEKK